MKARLPFRAGPPETVINGKPYTQGAVVILFRCEICLGELVKRNSGAACKTDPTHRGFIHRDEIKSINNIQSSLSEIEEQIWKTN